MRLLRSCTMLLLLAGVLAWPAARADPVDDVALALPETGAISDRPVRPVHPWIEVVPPERPPLAVHPWIEWGDDDCRGANVTIETRRVEAGTDVDRCTPVLHPDPLPDDTCSLLDRDCCDGIGTRCVSAAPIPQRHEVGSEWPFPFCAGVSSSGADLRPKLEMGSPCGEKPVWGQ